MSETDPNDPPPVDEPSDVPVYPEQDTPPGTESAIRVAAGPGEHDAPDEGQDDVDDDDLDPQAPHSPPDAGKGRVIFDENEEPVGLMVAVARATQIEQVSAIVSRE